MYKIVLTLLLLIYATNNSLIYASEPKAVVPEFCQKNFPAINPDDLNQKIQNTSADQKCTLSTHDGLEIPVGVRDLLSSYTSIQKKQNQRAIAQFQGTMRKKVAEGISQSRRPYEGLYDLMNCEKENASKDQKSVQSNCEATQNLTPQCSDSAVNRTLKDEENEYFKQKEGHVDQLLAKSAELAGVDINHPELKKNATRQEAEAGLKKNKKFSFLKRNIETALLAKALVAEKEVNEKAKIAELASSPVPQGGCYRGPRKNSERCKNRKNISERYVKLEEERQLSLATLYEEYPTALKLENNWEVNDWFNYQIYPNDFAHELDKRLIQKHPKLATMKRPEHIKEFLNSESGKKIIDDFTEQIIENPIPSIEEKGRQATIAELKKKKEAIEHICKSDGSDLHHFTGLAQQVLSESSGNPKRLVENQAAYCYLVQTSPLKEGGFRTGALVGAGVLVVGGVLLQVVPIAGNVVGSVAVAKGLAVTAGIAGSAIFSLDAVDRYQTSASQDENMKAVFHSANSWVTAEELIASQDRRYTQAAFAAGEVALSVADAAFIVRPALSLAVRLSSRASRTARTVSSAKNTEQVVTSGLTPATTRAPNSATTTTTTTTRPANDTMTPPLRSSDEMVSTSSLLVHPDRVQSLKIRPLETSDVNRIYSRISRGLMKEDALIDDFASLFRHKGSYSTAFTNGPKDLAITVYDALKLGNKDEALRILRASFEGKDSAASLRRLEKLETMIENVHRAQQVGLTNTPTHLMLEKFRNSGTVVRDKEVRGMTTRLLAGEKLSDDEYLKVVLHSGAHHTSPMTQESHRLAKGLKEAIENGDRAGAHQLIDTYYAGEGVSLSARGATNLKQIVDNSLGSAQSVGVLANAKNFVQANRKKIVIGAALIGTTTILSDIAKRTSDEAEVVENEKPEVESEAEVLPPTEDATVVTEKKRIKLRIKGGGDTLSTKPVDKQVEFEMEAYIDGAGALPKGSWKVECKSTSAGDDICPDSNYNESSGKQRVKLFKSPLVYELSFKYEAEEDGYESEERPVELVRICSTSELGPGVDLCEQAEKRKPADASDENVREPFWWQDLEPNLPPPPFTPGPPLRMRSFMLPGFI